MAGQTDAEAAARRRWRRPACRARSANEPVGAFRYLKSLKRRAAPLYVVAVYPLEVFVQHGAWQEHGAARAALDDGGRGGSAVHEPDLARLILALAQTPVVD